MATAQNSRQHFHACLDADQRRLRWIIARLPFHPADVWPVRKGRRVRGEINGTAFRTSLFPDPQGNGQVLLVNKKLQLAAKATVGSRVEIWLEPDLEERKAEMPEEFAKLLRKDRRLNKWLSQMSDSMRHEMGKWIAEPATAATRQKRAEAMVERLLLAMEGEQELPPVLRSAFAQTPLAEAGWKLLTPTQRRSHLLGIYYYQSPEARKRRAQKAVEAAEQAARKGSSK